MLDIGKIKVSHLFGKVSESQENIEYFQRFLVVFLIFIKQNSHQSLHS